VDAQALQQVGGGACQTGLGAQGLQEVGDQVEVQVQGLDLLLLLLLWICGLFSS